MVAKPYVQHCGVAPQVFDTPESIFDIGRKPPPV